MKIVRFFLVVIFTVLAAFNASAENRPKEVLRIGVAVNAPPWEAGNFIRDSARYLQWKLKDFNFDIEFLYPQEIREQVKKDQLDFVICSPILLSSLNEPSMRVLATLISRGDVNPDIATGGTVIVKKESGFKSLADLKGKKVGATSSDDFSGYVPVLSEISSSLREDPENFFGQVVFEGITEGRRLLRDLELGIIDAAIVRSGYLDEHFKASGTDLTEKLRILPLSEETPDSAIEKSTTRLYPNEVIAATPKASNRVVREVLAVLLSKPINGWGQYWSVAPDMSEVTGLLKNLKIGPFEYLRHWTWKRVWEQYRFPILLSLMLLLFLMFHSALAELQVRKRTAQLVKAMNAQKAAQEKLLKQNTKIANLERSGIVGQLSTIVAHEMKHHLAAIMHMNYALRRKVEDVASVPENVEEQMFEIDDRLEEINKQAQKAVEIIEHVRSYAKKESTKLERIDLAGVIKETCDDFILVRKWSYGIEEKLDPDCWVEAKRIEIEILVLNLLKNATEAALFATKPVVTVTLSKLNSDAKLTIANNGLEITEEQFEAMKNFAAASTKESGTGLGLGIIRTLCESMLARVDIFRNPEGGVIFNIYFPLAEKTELNSGGSDALTR